MKHRSIPVKGEGPLTDIIEHTGVTPIIDLPILRAIPTISRKASVRNHDGRKLGGVRLGEHESVTDAVQDGDTSYILTKKWLGTHNSTVTDGYFIHRLQPDAPNETTELTRMSYFSTDNGQVMLGLFHNGEENVPAAITRRPLQRVGYHRSMRVEYQPLRARLLGEGTDILLLDWSREITPEEFQGRTLIGATIPASTAPTILEKGHAQALEDVFEKEDLERVAEENLKKDLAHRPLCWGNSSCIPAKDFELVNPETYPQYRLGVGLDQTIYTAQRLAPESQLRP